METVTYGDSEADLHPHADADSYCYAHRDKHADGNPNEHADEPDAISDAHGHADPVISPSADHYAETDADKNTDAMMNLQATVGGVRRAEAKRSNR